MAMVNADSSCLHFGGLAAQVDCVGVTLVACRRSVCIHQTMNRVNFSNGFGDDDSTRKNYRSYYYYYYCHVAYTPRMQGVLTADGLFECVEAFRAHDGDRALHLGLVEHESRQLGKDLARRLAKLRYLLLRRRLKQDTNAANSRVAISSADLNK